MELSKRLVRREVIAINHADGRYDVVTDMGAVGADYANERAKAMGKDYPDCEMRVVAIYEVCEVE